MPKFEQTLKINPNNLVIKDQAVLVDSMEEVEPGMTATVKGRGIPAWLRGTLLSNGPGLFEFGSQNASHLFDGMAMVRRFALKGNSTMEYSRKFVQSRIYRANKAEKKQTKSGLGSTPSHWTMMQR